MPIEEDAVGSHDPDKVFARTAEERDYATFEASRRYPVGTTVLVRYDAKPVPGSAVIVDAGKLQALVLWPIADDGETIAPYKHTPRRKPRHLPADAKVVAVVVKTIIDEPHELPDGP